MDNRFYLIILISCLIFAAGCNQDGNKVAQTPASPIVEKKPQLTGPFRYHKMIEASPGQDFDVLSWGRGSKTVGSFLILHSDSAAKKYTTTTGDLDGTIIDVYNSDMDLDGNPEILIQAKATDTANYATIYAFEFNNSKANKLDFPKLTKSQRKGYQGEDNFYIKEGKFMREFPIFNGDGKDAKPTGQKRVLEYGLHGNSLTVKQLSKDSTDVKPNKTVAPAHIKTPVAEKKQTTTTKKSKKKAAPAKKKHKKHHHSNDN